MKTPRIPALRRHALGYWFCRWGCRDRYFERISSDPDAAISMPAYLRSIQQWRTWQDDRRQRRTFRQPVPLLADLATRFLQSRQLERGLDCRTYYTKHLRRFLSHYGAFPADTIRVSHLHAIKEDMLRQHYAPKTINHDIIAVRALFTWATDLEIIQPVHLKGVHTLPLGPPPDKSLSIVAVRSLIRRAPLALRPWLAVNYLAALRPSEVVRLVHQQGQWIARGVFRLDRGKMDLRSNWPRHCILSPEALSWLVHCRPRWSRLDSYSQAVRGQLGAGMGPGRLRHSASRHLQDAGISDPDIEMLLGHAPPRLRLIYRQPSWPALLASAGRLKLKSVHPPKGKPVAALAAAVAQSGRLSKTAASPTRPSRARPVRRRRRSSRSTRPAG